MVNHQAYSQSSPMIFPRSIPAEVANAVTHGIATLLSVLGLVLLIQKGLASSSWLSLLVYIIYGSSNILLFLASTLYHSLSYTRARPFFQKIDHAAIYILIAGSYTPYLVNIVGGRLGLIFLLLVWLVAISGMIFEVANTARFPRLSTFLYLALGWCGLLLAKPLFDQADLRGLLWLVLGGVLYSLGTIFYRQKKRPWMHVIWHLFVMAAAAAIFVSIYLYA